MGRPRRGHAVRTWEHDTVCGPYAILVDWRSGILVAGADPRRGPDVTGWQRMLHRLGDERLRVRARRRYPRVKRMVRPAMHGSEPVNASSFALRISTWPGTQYGAT